jgi:hypothetical protein
MVNCCSLEGRESRIIGAQTAVVCWHVAVRRTLTTMNFLPVHIACRHCGMAFFFYGLLSSGNGLGVEVAEGTAKALASNRTLTTLDLCGMSRRSTGEQAHVDGTYHCTVLSSHAGEYYSVPTGEQQNRTMTTLNLCGTSRREKQEHDMQSFSNWHGLNQIRFGTDDLVVWTKPKWLEGRHGRPTFPRC